MLNFQSLMLRLDFEIHSHFISGIDNQNLMWMYNAAHTITDEKSVFNVFFFIIRQDGNSRRFRSCEKR